jgi:hypothetical protein
VGHTAWFGSGRGGLQRSFVSAKGNTALEKHQNLNYPCDIFTGMIKGEVERVCAAMTDLCEPLHDTFTRAGQRAQERMEEDYLDHPIYRWLSTHVTRALAHSYLLKASLGPWTVGGGHARNGQLFLTDGSYSARILHALNDTDVPPPGPNRARQAYYHNVPLPLEPALFGPPSDKLLVLWRIHGADAVPTFRVVRPIGRWHFGSRAKADLDFILPETGAELEQLHFEPVDDGLELRIPKEEHDADGSGGFTR